MPRRPATSDQPFELLTTEQVAELLHLSISGLKSWRRQGIGPSWRRVGHRVLYRRADVERWFEQSPGA